MRKILLVLILLLPLCARSQTFKSYGLGFGLSFYDNGWSKPDTFSYYYHDKVYISTYNFGVFGEFLASRFLSTTVNVSLKYRKYFFEYDLGNISDAREVDNSFYIISLAAYEKIKYDFDRWSIYAFGGLKTDFRISKSISRDFQNVFANSESVIPGVTAGVGFAKRISRFWRISFDIYYDYDLTKMYESSTGYVRNNSIGLRIGFGPFNPANK